MGDKLQGLLAWFKTHLTLVISLVLVVAALGMLFGVVNNSRAAFEEELGQRSIDLNSIERFMNRRVTIPSEDPTNPTREIRLTVNPASVEALEKLYRQMNSGYQQLLETVVRFNRAGLEDDNPHDPLLPDLFPGPASSAAAFNAARAYQNTILNLYDNVLEAGTPPTSDEIDARMASVERDYLANALGATAKDAKLEQQKAQTRMNMLVDRARNIRVYGARPNLSGGNRSAGLFDIAPWAVGNERPEMDSLWAGQVELWVQQDLCHAIRLANTPDTPPPGQASVMTLPVKRVLNIDVSNEYHGGGDTQAQPDLTRPLPTNYANSPTGRVSNGLYDVRWANLTVMVDSTRIPALLNAIARVNFMTPIIQSITTVDLQKELADGYIYGQGVDVVQVELRIETLWLRQWTAGHATRDAARRLGQEFNPGLMPDMVRVRRGLQPRDESFASRRSETTTYGPDGEPFDPGDERDGRRRRD